MTMLAVFCVLSLLLGFFLGVISQRRPSLKNLQLLGQLSLGFREKIVWVGVQKQTLILGLTPGRIECLMEGPSLDEAETVSAEKGFSDLLMQWRLRSVPPATKRDVCSEEV